MRVWYRKERKAELLEAGDRMGQELLVRAGWTEGWEQVRLERWGVDRSICWRGKMDCRGQA